MLVDDFNEVGADIDRAALERRLKSVRHGNFGSFLIYKSKLGPQVWLSINADLAYVHYFDDASGANAGFQSESLGQPDLPNMLIDFIQIDKDYANGFAMPMQYVIPLSDAITAALEFFDTNVRPRCISWAEL